MTPAFVATTALPTLTKSASARASLCVFDGFTKSAPAAGLPAVSASPLPGTVTMRCRRDLKKEKSLRNLEFARAHRKRIVRNFNRRAVKDAVTKEDNDFLSDVYGTITIMEDKHGDDK